MYVLLNSKTLRTTCERKKPCSNLERPYNSKLLNVKMTFAYGIPFTPDLLFRPKGKDVLCPHPYDDLKQPHLFKAVPECRDLSVLKSTLQKCVRRGLVEEALMCAKSMMAMNFRSFCRRLLVIAAEDVFYDQTCLTLIWMFKMSDGAFATTSSTPTYKPSTRHVNYLLGFVKALCEEKRCVRYGKEDILMDDKSGSAVLLQLFMNSTVLMTGDAGMLKWYHNHASEITYKLSEITSIDEQNVEYMTWERLPLEGIDFHTHKFLPGMIHIKFPEFSVDRIKDLIWHCRSSLNYRKFNPFDDDAHQQCQQDFDKIRRAVDDACLYLRAKLSKAERIEFATLNTESITTTTTD